MSLTGSGRRDGTGSRWRLRLAAVAALLPLLLLASGSGAVPGARDISVTARPISAFGIGSGETRFGALDYLGGFSYRASDRRLAGVSSIRLSGDAARFLAITDTGYWLSGRIDRDAAGRPTGFSAVRLAPILGRDGEAQTRKGDADAEGLAVEGARAVVAFERDHRVEAFAGAAAPFGSLPEPVDLPIPRRELRANGGIETIAVSPPDGPLGGATVVVAEQSIDRAGHFFAAILGRDGGIFTVRREAPWAVTDGAFLPGGDLLLLERRYEGFGRLGMRIRRIDGEAIRPGALVDGDTLIEADLGNEIDNMEGLDVSVGANGAVTLALVSDNNGSFFQRNLYLEFRLAEAEPPAG